MSGLPAIDVNLIVHNGAATIGPAIESVLAQDWPALSITVFDNASTDGTADIAAAYAGADPRITVRATCFNVGQVLNCQRAFWHGGADYLMLKTADDLLAPGFIPAVMAELLANPQAVMCHAAGLVFDDAGRVHTLYPPDHVLHATGDDPVARARHVMARYTSAPAFWGIYRRRAVEMLPAIPYDAGWDHALLAELALYGEIRGLDSLLFWRRNGGKPVADIARGASAYTQRALPLDDDLADLRWHTPLVTTAYAHIPRFALARLPAARRHALMESVPEIFRARWLPLMRQEATRFHRLLPGLLDRAIPRCVNDQATRWRARHLHDALTALDAILPEEGFGPALLELAAFSQPARA